MAKKDEDTGSALAEALAAPLAAGSLEVGLHAARAFHMRFPGNEDAKRVLEALELLQAQVWFSGTDDEEDPRYSVAAQHLEAVDLPGALARYEEITETEGDSSRAVGLALGVRVVMAAAAGDALPAIAAEPEAAQPEPAAPAPLFQETTRIAGDGELPLNAFETDEVTSNVDAVLTPEAYPDEPTRHLNLGDYEIIDESDRKKPPPPPIPAFQGFDDPDEQTGVMNPEHARQLAAKTAPQSPHAKAEKEVTRIAGVGELPLDDFRKHLEVPSPPKLDAKGKKIPPAPKVEKEVKEVTRIAGANELPLAELRRQMEGESADKDLDDLIDDMDDVAPPPLPPAPSAIEGSLMLDITVMPDFEEERAEEPPPPPPKAPPVVPRPPIAPEPSVAIDISALPDFEAEAIERAVAEAEAAAQGSLSVPHREPVPDDFATEDTPPAMHAAPPPVLVPPPPPMSKQIIDAGPVNDDEEVLSPPPEDYEERVTAPPPLDADLDAVTAAETRGPVAPARGPVVPAPPRGPVVPRPPGMGDAQPPPMVTPPSAPPKPLSADPIHAPLDTSEVALPSDAWAIREPGEEDDDSESVAHVEVGLAEASWSGVQTFAPHAAVFEPGAEPVTADTWGDEVADTKSAAELEAEAMVARGELGEALRVYQDLAVQHADRPELWDRVAQIARMLQQRSGA